MKSFLRQSLLLLPLMLAPGCDKSGVSSENLWGATVQEISVPSAPSGVFAAFVTVKVATPEGKPMNLQVIYLAEDQDLPLVGQRCNVTYITKSFTSHGGAWSDPKNIVKTMNCMRPSLHSRLL